jgi:hypothetical protein
MAMVADDPTIGPAGESEPRSIPASPLWAPLTKADVLEILWVLSEVHAEARENTGEDYSPWLVAKLARFLLLERWAPMPKEPT